MKSLRKIFALTLVALFTLACFTGCGKKDDTDSGKEVEAAKQIRYLNFKPEIAEIYC